MRLELLVGSLCILGGYCNSIKVLGISGSLRGASTNSGLLRALRDTQSDSQIEMDIMDVSQLPLFNPDKAGSDAIVQQFQLRLAAADAVLVTSPRLTGPLQNALDHMRGAAKPAAIIVSGLEMEEVRAAAARASLVVCPTTLGCTIMCPALQVTPAQNAFDAEGNLVDTAVLQQSTTLVRGLKDWVQLLTQSESSKPSAADLPATEILQSDEEAAAELTALENASVGTAATTTADAAANTATDAQSPPDADSPSMNHTPNSDAEGSSVSSDSAKEPESGRRQGDDGALRDAPSAQDDSAKPDQQKVDSAPEEEETESTDPNCMDVTPECRVWAKAGECEVNTEYMEEACRRACKMC